MLTDEEKDKLLKKLERAYMIRNFTSPFQNLTWNKILRRHISIEGEQLKFDEEFSLTEENVADLRDAARADFILQCTILAISGFIIGYSMLQLLGI